MWGMWGTGYWKSALESVNLTKQFIPRDLYVVSDINPHYLHYLYLRSYAHGKPYIHVPQIDARNPEYFQKLEDCFDTVLMINVLEHVPDEQVALKNIWSTLKPGGHAVILAPCHPGLQGSLDMVLGHRQRYTKASLQQALERAGFRVGRLFDLNRCSVPGWWVNGKLLGKKTFSKLQLELLDSAIPILKHIDRLWPWQGLSLIASAVKD